MKLFLRHFFRSVKHWCPCLFLRYYLSKRLVRQRDTARENLEKSYEKIAMLEAKIEALLIKTRFAEDRTTILQIKANELELRAIQAEQLSERDQLTALLNRRALGYYVPSAILAVQRTQLEPFHVSVIMIDLDHFKEVNDTLGHEAGDNVLKKITDHFHRVFTRRTDYVIRLGGDEFLVITLHAPPTMAMKLTGRFLDNLNKDPELVLPSNNRVTASIGIASLDTASLDIDNALRTAMKKADEAVYKSKAAGRNTIFLA